MRNAGAAWSSLELPDLLARLDADVFHSPLFVLPSVRPCACVATIHDVIPRARPDLTSADFSNFFEASVPHAIQAAARIVTVSEFSKGDILRYFPDAAGKVEVVYQPIAPQFRQLAPDEARRHLGVLGLDPGFALFVGAIDRRKGLVFLLDAWALLPASGARPLLVIAGAPSGDALNLNTEVAQRGLGKRVRLLGRVSDDHLPALYGGASAFIFPTLYEGFGLPVLEAMACGTPVVTTGCSSLPEVSGGAAVLVAPESARELADGIQRILSDRALAADLKRRGLLRAAEFSLECQARQMRSLYEAVAREAR